MAGNTVDIGANITVDASEFKKGMKEARDAAKGFATEEKLLDSEMKANGTTVQGLNAKYKALCGQVDAQKKKIELLKAQYIAVCEAQGNNSDEAKALATQLRKESTELTNLQAKATQANVALMLLKKAATACRNILVNVATKMAEAWKESLKIATDAAQKWDDVATAAKQAQTSTEEYQGLQYATFFLDFDIEAYNKAKNKLQLLSEQTISDAFSSAGVEFDWDGIDFGDKASLFNAVLAQLGGADSSQQAAIEKALFGDELGVKMRTLYGDEAVQQLRELQAEAERLGIITGEAGAKSLQSLNDAHDKFNQVKDGLFMNLGAVFADNFAAMFDSAAEYMGIFSKGLQMYKEAGGGEEGKKAAEEYVNGMLTALDEDGDTVGSNLIEGFADAIENFGIMADLAGILVNALATELTENATLQTALESLGETLNTIWAGEDGESGIWGLIQDIGDFFVSLWEKLIYPFINETVLPWLKSMASEVGLAFLDAIDPNGLIHQTAKQRAIEAYNNGEYTEEPEAGKEYITVDGDTARAAWEQYATDTGFIVPSSDEVITQTAAEAAAAAAAETLAGLDWLSFPSPSGGGRADATSYTETDNSTHEQNVTIYVSGAATPQATGNKIAQLLSEYYERNERARSGGAKGNTRAHVIYE